VIVPSDQFGKLILLAQRRKPTHLLLRINLASNRARRKFLAAQ
jgi:hypothetical protein